MKSLKLKAIMLLIFTLYSFTAMLIIFIVDDCNLGINLILGLGFFAMVLVSAIGIEDVFYT